ncbi:MAG: DUF2029 domain-containing protein [Acidimicrobiales bacterium]|nr:DUF2029 domain-containing protein [Acidimicrobiales bacterium]
MPIATADTRIHVAGDGLAGSTGWRELAERRTRYTSNLVSTFLNQVKTKVDQKIVRVIATIVAWGFACDSILGLYQTNARAQNLGYDLLITWRAESLFAVGGQPYSVRGFLYPPSILLLLRPIAGHSQASITKYGLVLTIVISIAAVMLAAVAIGRPWFGMTAALTTFGLSYTGAFTGELSLENVSVLCWFALSVFLLAAINNKWIIGGIAIGLSFAFKPLLLPLLVVFLLARQWKALLVAIGLPFILNLVAVIFVADPMAVLSKLPSLTNRVGTGVNFNSAWVDVARNLGWPEFVTILIRSFTAIVAVGATWISWTRIDDKRLRLITSSSVLLIGTYLAGTISEYHFMLTLVPLLMTVVVAGSVMRIPISWIGGAWMMTVLILPGKLLGLGIDANNSAFRAFGMSIILLSVFFWHLRKAKDIPKKDDQLATEFNAT